MGIQNETAKRRGVSRRAKIIISVVGGVVAVVVLGGGLLFTIATRAANDFRSASADQLNQVLRGEPGGATVELNGVLLGEQLNPTYRKIASAQVTYQKLLDSVRDYTALLKVHNALVAQYNKGMNGEKPLGGDMLKTVNNYAATLENLFKDETARRTALTELSDKITASTDFAALTDEIDAILRNNETWLAQRHDALNRAVDEFGKIIQN